MKFKKISVLLTITFLSFVSINAAFAGNSSNSKVTNQTNSSSKSVTLTKSIWLLPKVESTTNYIEVKSGSAIPVQFQISNGTAEIAKGDVRISSVVVQCPTGIPSPTPSTSNINSPKSPGKSVASEIRYLGKTWKAIWKLDKSAQGCFQLKANVSGGAASNDALSPIFVSRIK
ncbi:MAG: hypothetical protein ACKN92_02425 [Candidatus Nanopelagicaceae bacterium]